MWTALVSWDILARHGSNLMAVVLWTRAPPLLFSLGSVSPPLPSTWLALCSSALVAMTARGKAHDDITLGPKDILSYNTLDH